VQQPSPLTSLTMLILWKQRRIDITREDYDLFVDTVVGVLEEANDETFRLEPRGSHPEG